MSNKARAALIHRADRDALVAGQIVHEDEVPNPQCGDAAGFDRGLKPKATERPVQPPRRTLAACGAVGDESGGFPVVMRRGQPAGAGHAEGAHAYAPYGAS